MEFHSFLTIIGIIAFVLYLFIEPWLQDNFVPFAYIFGFTIKKKKLKIKPQAFNTLKLDFFHIENINYKFISSNTCLIRLGEEKVSFFRYLIPFPMGTHKIIISNDQYEIIHKISFIHLIIFGILIYDIVLIIFLNQKININTFSGIIIASILSVLIIIISIKKTNKIAIIFLKILKKNKKTRCNFA